MIKKSRSFTKSSTVNIFFTKFCQIQINHFNGLNFLLFIRLWIIKPCIKLNFKCSNNEATTHVNRVDFSCTFYDQSPNSFSVSGHKFSFKIFPQLLSVNLEQSIKLFTSQNKNYTRYWQHQAYSFTFKQLGKPRFQYLKLLFISSTIFSRL